MLDKAVCQCMNQPNTDLKEKFLYLGKFNLFNFKKMCESFTISCQEITVSFKAK